MAVKMYAIFAREALEKFKGSEGRLAAQAGHAYLHAYWAAEELCGWYDVDWMSLKWGDTYVSTCRDYRYENNAIKIALVVDECRDLEYLYELYKDKCGVSLVEENSYTPKPLTTCLGLGPIRDEDRCDLLRGLKLLNREL